MCMIGCEKCLGHSQICHDIHDFSQTNIWKEQFNDIVRFCDPKRDKTLKQPKADKPKSIYRNPKTCLHNQRNVIKTKITPKSKFERHAKEYYTDSPPKLNMKFYGEEVLTSMLKILC